MIHDTVTTFDLQILQRGGVTWEQLSPSLRQDAGLAAQWKAAEESGTKADDTGWTLPTDDECILFWTQLYQDETTNGFKSLHFVQTVYSGTRPYVSSSSTTTTAHEGTVLEPIFGLPDINKLVDMVWDIVPSYLRAQIKIWAKTKNSQPIAKAISSIVATVIGPLGIPGFLVDGIVGILVPQLVSLLFTVVDDLPD
ncbi:hypothetical protein CNMCM5793_005209 [Aspergillus hiratsukae]|uniref:Uncharacterized protein n=1 Tax=Aspergillus hiratsukae TaxID=1194566 RepID=A0A8H6V3Y2_9EURO|nr:hypothetical protein CNMCM5793_005209 [Aspergillus hiratsukae]KAF7173030.1 hypothetical protein CNMCM6106_007173 [Aspergillus hiratsukae]